MKRDWYKTPSGESQRRKDQLKHKYGVSPETYATLFESQGGRCAVCGTSFETAKLGAGGYFSVDHNHTTGVVRGLLCTPCNTGLGLLQDSPSILQSALNYLNNRGYYGP